jgi:hypothetical protein
LPTPALELTTPANRATWYDGHVSTLWREYGLKARAGILRQTGRTDEWLTPDVLAVPWWRVL